MAKSEPRLTVLMTVYNGEPYIKDAVVSILNQTYSNFNFLILDNASIDDSIKIINSFNDPRIKIIELSSNIGQTEALNKGLKMIKSKYTARMDADDIVVGAASIIAKFTRDAMIERLSEELEMNLGSGYPSDRITRDAVRELCLGDEPHDCLRWSWSTVRDVWTNGHQSPLPERGAGANHPAQSSLKDWN